MKPLQPLRPARHLLTLIGVLLIVISGTVLAQTKCQLKSPSGRIKHVIYVQFDNTHFLRDNPNVPSDLEQMPHLLNFIKDNGVLMANDHTALISHTATGILTSLTGVYPDRMGQPVSNSFRYFKTDGTTRTGVAFVYWTAPLFDPAGSTTHTTAEMINENGKIAPFRTNLGLRSGLFPLLAHGPHTGHYRVAPTRWEPEHCEELTDGVNPRSTEPAEQLLSAVCGEGQSHGQPQNSNVI